jgi:hypothetical protein
MRLQQLFVVERRSIRRVLINEWRVHLGRREW